MKYRAVLAWILAISSVSATIINVPVNYTTIQAAIDTASAGDTVLVQPGTYVENINFIGKNIVVGSLFLTTGNTAYISQTVIDGDSSGSVVMFESGENSTTIICGFTITNGFGHDPTWEIPFPPTAIGGGITCRDSSSPTLRDLVIAKNNAVSMGGGIYCLSSNPLLINVTIVENSSHRGGGIYLDLSSPSLNHVVITENSALYGGGILCDESNPTLTNVAIKLNEAILQGGGIYCEGNSNPIFDPDDRPSVFLNKAGLTGYDLFTIDDATINVVVDTFTVINPTEFHAYPMENFSFDILNAKIEPVLADLYVDPNGSDNNSGLSPTKPLQTIGYALVKVDADSSHPRTILLGEGVYSPSATGENYPIYWRSYVSLLGAGKGVTILDAEGQNGVIFCYDDSSFSIESLTIRNSAAGYWGGAIDCNGSSPTLSHLEISDNSCSGIYCWDRSSPILNDVTLSRNTADRGSGLYCAVHSSPTLTNVIITENAATTGGGGIYCREYSSPVLTHVTISGNSGGGIYCDDYSSPSLSNVTINDNTGRGISCVNSTPELDHVIISGNSGGGLFLSSSNATLVNVVISGNTAGGGGGGIWISHSEPTLTNVAIIGNTGTKGGGIFCSTSSPFLTNVTMAKNVATDTYYGGGGIYCFDHSYPTLVNTILWNNDPQEIYYHWGLPDDSNAVTISYSDVQGGIATIVTNDLGTINWLDGNIDTDPLFVDAENGDFHLQEGSPTIDAGTAFFAWEGDTLVNLSADDYVGSAPDMGAFEFGALSTEDDSPLLPTEFVLHQNYPNPFNPATTIRYNLPQDSRIRLTVYDIIGRELVRLRNESDQAGYHSIIWNGRDNAGREVPSGIYIARLVTPGYTKSIKMVLLR